MKYTIATATACLCLAAALAGMTAIQAAEKGDIQKAIEQANEAFMEAFSQGDAEALAAMYTSDGMLLPPQQGAVEGPKEIRAFWQGVAESAANAFILRTVEVEAHGDIVFEVGNYIMTDENEKTMDTGKYMVIWKREGGAWKLHRDIWNTSIAQSGS